MNKDKDDYKVPSARLGVQGIDPNVITDFREYVMRKYGKKHTAMGKEVEQALIDRMRPRKSSRSISHSQNPTTPEECIGDDISELVRCVVKKEFEKRDGLQKNIEGLKESSSPNVVVVEKSPDAHVEIEEKQKQKIDIEPKIGIEEEEDFGEPEESEEFEDEEEEEEEYETK